MKLYWIKDKHMNNPYVDGYIGVTNRDVEDRLKEHRVSKNKHLLSALKKYDIVIELLCEGEESDILNLEQKYRPLPNIGWNITVGGGMPPSTKEWWSEKHSLNASERLFGNNYKLGKKESETTKNKKRLNQEKIKKEGLKPWLKISKESRLLSAINRKGKGLGGRNSMASEENRKKVGTSKLGRKKMFSPSGQGFYIKSEEIENHLLIGYYFK